jgi:alpha 1,3-glucosidase
MKADPYTLVLVLGSNGDAEGDLYVDDGESFDYKQGAFIHRKFKFERASSTVVSVDAAPEHGKLYEQYAKTMTKIRVEKIVVVNAPDEWKDSKTVAVSEGDGKESKVDFTWNKGGHGQANWAVVRDPKVAIGKDWVVKF